jgi:hypothetical protein
MSLNVFGISLIVHNITLQNYRHIPKFVAVPLLHELSCIFETACVTAAPQRMTLETGSEETVGESFSPLHGSFFLCEWGRIEQPLALAKHEKSGRRIRQRYRKFGMAQKLAVCKQTRKYSQRHLFKH